MPTVWRPAMRDTMACADAAPTEPASSRSNLEITASVACGRPTVMPCDAAISSNKRRAGSRPKIRCAKINMSSASAAPAEIFDIAPPVER